jgi:hypothetical protein
MSEYIIIKLQNNIKHYQKTIRRKRITIKLV